MASFRYDSSLLANFTRTAAGGISVPASIARTGIQVYQTPDGRTIREWRSPDEVFDADSLNSLADAPVTVGHPKANGIAIPVTPKNVKELSSGHVAGPPIRGQVDGDSYTWMSTDLLLTAADAQDAVSSGSVCEVSAGYTCDYDDTPGVTDDGQAYDRKQTNIRFNHVALLPKGAARAGSNAKLRLDGNQELLDEPNPADADQHTKVTPMKIKIDGIEYEVGSASHIDALNKRITDLEASVTASATQLSDSETEAGSSAAKIDELEKSLAEAKEASSPETLEASVKDALEFRAQATKLVGDGYDFAGKSKHEVRVEALKDLKLDGKSADYVEAAYDLKLDSIDEEADKPDYKIDEKTTNTKTSTGFDHKALYLSTFGKAN